MAARSVAVAMTDKPRRFPPPWTVKETQPCFIIRDHTFCFRRNCRSFVEAKFK